MKFKIDYFACFNKNFLFMGNKRNAVESHCNCRKENFKEIIETKIDRKETKSDKKASFTQMEETKM